uniref:Uncharacterized protein n=1 Tax=Anguilla anguilla TaxID=7936 RepID=A0A0E9U611_ANGAN
MNRVRSGAYKI